jgi:hypothetical protein
VLFDVDRGRLARGAHHADAVGAFGDVPVDQLAQRGVVHAAVFVHGRDEGDDAAGEGAVDVMSAQVVGDDHGVKALPRKRPGAAFQVRDPGFEPLADARRRQGRTPSIAAAERSTAKTRCPRARNQRVCRPSPQATSSTVPPAGTSDDQRCTQAETGSLPWPADKPPVNRLLRYS